MLALDTLTFIYDPYPIGSAEPAFPLDVYERLCSSFPPAHLFEYQPSLGHKYSLSEVNHPEQYEGYVRSQEPWRAFHHWIKRGAFPYEVLAVLRARRIDLGITSRPLGLRERARGAVAALRGEGRGAPRLGARFEFSMLPAAGGCIKPHTDQPRKLVTLVVGMCAAGEWDPAYGGGTDVMRPKDITRNYNFVNAQLDFDEVDVLRTFPYRPNQCVVFVKTFNSLHAVRPMRGNGGDLMRKTLTINIEEKVAGAP